MKFIKVMVNGLMTLLVVLAANGSIFSSGVGNPILAWTIVSIAGAVAGAVVNGIIDKVEIAKTFKRMSEEIKEKTNKNNDNDDTVNQ